MPKFTVQDKNEIILIAAGTPAVQVGAVVHLPLALLSLAAWIREKSDYARHLKIYDANLCKISPECFLKAAIVGISAMSGSQVKYGLQAAAMVRAANPDAVIVWGGIHASLMPEQTIQNKLVDVVVAGEGEETFLEVVDAIFSNRDLAGIPGTYVLAPDGELVRGGERDFLNLDDLPLPAYDLISIGDYSNIEGQFDYQTSRGCPFRCAFCYNVAFCNRRYRSKSPNKVIQELICLHEKYGVKNFGLVDDEFFVDRKRVEEIFDGILQSGRGFSLIASCRLDIVQRLSPELLLKMRESGVTRLFLGAESGSPAILEAIKKDISTDDIINGAKTIVNSGIEPVLSFMSGFPGETQEDLDKTEDMILELWELDTAIIVNGVFPFNAYPGTSLYQTALDLGLKSPSSLEEWGEYSFQYKPDNPWLDAKTIKRIEILFYMVRFKYYFSRLEAKYKDYALFSLLKILMLPLFSSVKFRMKYKLYGMAFEWKIIAFVFRKTFGYL